MPEPSDLAAEFVERDERQALRMQRYLIAAGTSVLVCLMLIWLAFLHALPWRAALAGYVSRLRLRLSDSHRDLKAAFERIEQLAIRAELTGLYNRRFLMECLARERSRAERLGVRFCVCLIDIDHFKSINDTLGH